jgi:hypothetical protein
MTEFWKDSVRWRLQTIRGRFQSLRNKSKVQLFWNLYYREFTSDTTLFFFRSEKKRVRIVTRYEVDQ